MEKHGLKKIGVLAVFITFLGTGSLFAQMPDGPQRMGRHGAPGFRPLAHCIDGGCAGFSMHSFAKYDFLQKVLKLSDKQVKEIFSIDQEFREKFFDSRENPDKILELRLKHRKAVEKVLNKEQKKRFDDMFLGRFGRRGMRPGPHMRPNPDK